MSRDSRTTAATDVRRSEREKRFYHGGDPKSQAGKPLSKSDALGQVSTPPDVASAMAGRFLAMLEGDTVLDPCVGEHVFPSALLEKRPGLSGLRVKAVDVDPLMISLTREWAAESRVEIKLECCNYLTRKYEDLHDGIIMNPPFTRQEWITNKKYYRELFLKRYGVHIPGTSNLYVYFLVKAVFDVRPGGAISAIVYDSWTTAKFGLWLQRFLMMECEGMEVTTVAESPFLDRLIDATIMTVKRRKNPMVGKPFLQDPASSATRSPFSGVDGFVPLKNLFSTRRGLRLKQADFFLTSRDRAESIGATFFLKKVAKVPGFVVPDDHDEAALLVTSRKENPAAYVELLRRLGQAVKEPEKNVSIITWFRERPEMWYRHAPAPRAPIVFNYYVRNRPKHIYNPKLPFSDNFYGLTPIHASSLFLYLAILNSTAVCVEALAGGRNQGSGLTKLQLYEYRDLLIPNPDKFSVSQKKELSRLGHRLVDNPKDANTTVKCIDEIIRNAFRDDRLSRDSLKGLYSRFDRNNGSQE